MSAVKKAKNNPFVDATAGAIAGCAARFVVGPLDVIKIRFQVQLEPIAKRAAGIDPTSLTSKYTGLRQALSTIVKEEGIPVSSHSYPIFSLQSVSVLGADTSAPCRDYGEALCQDSY